MTRLLLYIMFFCVWTTYAQTDTVYTYNDTIETWQEHENEYTETSSYKEPPAIAIQEPVYTARKFNPQFKDRYTSDDFNYKTEPPADSWILRVLAWIRKIWHAIFGSSVNSGAAPSNASDIVYGILATIVILIAIYFVVRSILGKESLWIFGRSSKKITATDAEAENIHEMDFASLIDKTKQEQDYRLAVRYYYLWLLKKLSAREIIAWNWDKTNNDYYYEIKDNSLRDDFRYLSYIYDHSWYGDFDVDEKAFAKAEKSFKKTLNTL